MTDESTVHVDSASRAALSLKVLPMLERFCNTERAHLAVLVTPELGIKVVTRGELVAHLRYAGLEREAAMVMRIARGESHAFPCWAEVGADVDAAECGFFVLRFDKGERRYGRGVAR